MHSFSTKKPQSCNFHWCWTCLIPNLVGLASQMVAKSMIKAWHALKAGRGVWAAIERRDWCSVKVVSSVDMQKSREIYFWFVCEGGSGIEVLKVSLGFLLGLDSSETGFFREWKHQGVAMGLSPPTDLLSCRFISLEVCFLNLLTNPFLKHGKKNLFTRLLFLGYLGEIISAIRWQNMSLPF